MKVREREVRGEAARAPRIAVASVSREEMSRVWSCGKTVDPSEEVLFASKVDVVRWRVCIDCAQFSINLQSLASNVPLPTKNSRKLSAGAEAHDNASHDWGSDWYIPASSGSLLSKVRHSSEAAPASAARKLPSRPPSSSQKGASPRIVRCRNRRQQEIMCAVVSKEKSTRVRGEGRDRCDGEEEGDCVAGLSVEGRRSGEDGADIV